MATFETRNACWCGCKGTTKSRFVPGHDARFHGWAKKIARDEIDGAVVLAQLPHPAAEAELIRHVNLEIPKHEARVAAGLARNNGGDPIRLTAPRKPDPADVAALVGDPDVDPEIAALLAGL